VEGTFRLLVSESDTGVTIINDGNISKETSEFSILISIGFIDDDFYIIL
jgi:hypothetical protein